MRIRYKNTKLIGNFLVVVILAVMAVRIFMDTEQGNLFAYVFSVMAIFQIINSFKMIKTQYIKIESGTIKKFGTFSSEEIKVENIKYIEKTFQEIWLNAEEKILKIEKNKIAELSLNNLESYLKETGIRHT